MLASGFKDVDRIFERVATHMEQAKQEMKARLREAFVANYRASLDRKSQTFLHNLDKLEKYVVGCVEDFERRLAKGKFVVVCAQRPKVDELYRNAQKLQASLSKMCEAAREFRSECSISFKPLDFDADLKALLNAHVGVAFPGLEQGFFPSAKR